MLYVIFIAVFVYILSNISWLDTNVNEIMTLVKETHKYSGIHEETYGKFYTNMQMAIDHKSDIFLHKAVHHLNDIPLYMSPIDPDIQTDIAVLGQKIIIATEHMLIKNAMNTNTTYRPKYI